MNEIKQEEFQLLMAKAKAFDMVIARDALAVELHKSTEALKRAILLLREAVEMCDESMTDKACTLRQKITAELGE